MTIRAGAEALQPVEQQIGQQERGQVVDRKGHLVPVRRPLEFRRKQAGVVDQEIDPVVRGQDLVGQAAHFGQRGEIGERGLDLRPARPLGRRTGAPPRCGQRSRPVMTTPHPGAGEAQCRIEPDPGARPGDDRHSLAGVVRHVSTI